MTTSASDQRVEEALDRVEEALQPDWLARDYMRGPIKAAVDVLLDEIQNGKDQIEALKFNHQLELEERYNDGKRAMRAKTQQVNEMVGVLEAGRALIAKAKVWEGPEEWQAETLQQFDDLITHLKS